MQTHSRKKQYQLIDATTGQVVIEHLEIANSFWSRFVGLQFRRELPPSHGVMLVPCRSIHTCWMRFPIDVIFLDTQNTVLDIRSSVRPWRTAASKHGRPHATLEIAAGSNQLAIGDRLQVIERVFATVAPDLQR